MVVFILIVLGIVVWFLCGFLFTVSTAKMARMRLGETYKEHPALNALFIIGGPATWFFTILAAHIEHYCKR